MNTYITLVNDVVLMAVNIAAMNEDIEVTRDLSDNLESQFEVMQTLANAGRVGRSDFRRAHHWRVFGPVISRHRSNARPV
jgi:outer membrane protein TolC